MNEADAISQLAADLEGLTLSLNNGGGSSTDHELSSPPPPVLLPSLQQFYRLGLLLFQINGGEESASSSGGATTTLASPDTKKKKHDLVVTTAYQDFVQSIPTSLLRHTFQQLQRATDVMLRNNNNSNSNAGDLSDWSSLIPTCQSLCGLLISSSSSSSPKLSQAVYSHEWVATLATLYDRLVVLSSSSKSKPKQPSMEESSSIKNAVLSTLSSLLLNGIFSPKPSSSSSSSLSWEELLLEAVNVMENASTDCLGDLQLWQSNHEPLGRTLMATVQQQQQDPNDDHERSDYILTMLESALKHQQRQQDGQSIAAASPLSQPPATTTKIFPKTTAATELDRRIQQVHQVLPHLGHGFIEAALSLHQADVERTVAVLLNDVADYPPALRVLDPTLPRRKRDHVHDNGDEAQEARQLVKERVAFEEQQEAARYKALLYVSKQQQQQESLQGHDIASNIPTHVNSKDEYNDDYDDQYDELDIRLGNADDGYADDGRAGANDYEQVKLYNQLVRDDEKDEAFWNDQRNTNRRQPSGKKGGGNGAAKEQDNDDHDDDGDTSPPKHYRGPDKIKGGRVIGPDGKLVKKPGGGRPRKKGPSSQQQQQQSQQGKSAGGNSAKGGNSSSNNNNNKTAGQQPSSTNAAAAANNNNNNKKPRTKPKADNRVNRQRDRKQRNQGAFGVQE